MRKTKEKFIEESIRVHGDKYDYSKVEYKSTHEKVCIICPEHGEFWQSPHNHIKGFGCQKCGFEKTSSFHTIGNEEFIKRARIIWGDKYDYSKVKYVNGQTKVCIISPEHGEFWQTPISHLKGVDIFKKKNPWETSRKRNTIDDFIYKAREIHGDKYDYSRVEYKSSHEKVCIICPEHGEFWQTPSNHLSGKGCQKCSWENNALKNKITTEEWISKAREIHGDKYDYSKTKYVNSKTNVCIICPKHGEFYIEPHLHLKGYGCKKCKKNEEQKYKTKEFIEKAKDVHGNRYDYSKVEYKNSVTKVCIICQKHGEFWQAPINHLNNRGCLKCHLEKKGDYKKLTTEEFIKRAKKIWGNRFDYSKVNYKYAHEKVCIICPEHGEFWQTPTNHLSGYGCLECSKTEYTKETLLKNILFNEFKEEKIVYQAHLPWLGKQSFDLYFPKYKIAVEYQGAQHFKPIKMFGGEDTFIVTRNRDIKKNILSKRNGVTIFYFSFSKHDIGDFPYDVIFDTNILLNKIHNIIDNYEK